MFPLLAISDRRHPGAPPLPVWAEGLGRAGVAALQLREKDLPDAATFALAAGLRAALPAGTRLLVNGRADIALAAGADGVHLPSDGLPTATLRRQFGSRLLLGRSTHRVEEVGAEADAGADYVTFGPVFATPGKGSGLGLEELRRATRCGIPVLALGGVGVAELPRVAAAGAAGAAGIRLFQNPSGLPAVVAAAREAFGR